MAKSKSGCRNLVIVLGDQLNADSAAFDEFDSKRDVVWMAEVAEESTHVWTHKARIVMFLASMRHFRDRLVKRKINLHYRQLDHRGNQGTLASELVSAVKKLEPERLILVEPGEWRVRESFLKTADSLGLELELRVDRKKSDELKAIQKQARRFRDALIRHGDRSTFRATPSACTGTWLANGLGRGRGWECSASAPNGFDRHSVANGVKASGRFKCTLAPARTAGNPLRHYRSVVVASGRWHGLPGGWTRGIMGRMPMPRARCEVASYAGKLGPSQSPSARSLRHGTV